MSGNGRIQMPGTVNISIQHSDSGIVGAGVFVLPGNAVVQVGGINKAELAAVQFIAAFVGAGMPDDEAIEKGKALAGKLYGVAPKPADESITERQP